MSARADAARAPLPSMTITVRGSIPSARPVLRLVSRGASPALPTSSLGPSDASLVARARAADRDAKHALYERHVAYLAGLCIRMLRSRNDGLDVVQDAFVVAFTRLDTLVDPSAFRAWMAQIAVRLVRKRLRRARIVQFFGFGDLQRDAHDGEPRDELDAIPGLSYSDGTAEARSELDAIDRALSTLPPEQRIAWSLRHLEGEPLEAVAQACDCSLATAKRWIRAAELRVAATIEVPS